MFPAHTVHSQNSGKALSQSYEQSSCKVVHSKLLECSLTIHIEKV